MNSIEVWYIEDEHEIEETVNTYLRQWDMNPLSVSVVYCAKKDLWVVTVVVERKGGE
jgi:hypothetical protein